uniref:VWFA domain-containing protein n=1 Tax=Panagrolaimus sp. JU765 TaxID=591449 RepID=A0AC34RC04_9BILA
MKLFTVIWITGLFLIVFASPIKTDQSCSGSFPAPVIENCDVDLTVAVDMSLAMQTTENIQTLVDDLLANFFTVYDIQSAHTSLIAFGTGEVDSSDYFDNYGKLCDYLQSSEEQAIEMGIITTDLSDVYTTFQDNQLVSGRNLKKYFVVVTAITDSDNVATAVGIFNQIKTEGGNVVFVSLNNPNQIGDFSKIADKVVYETGYAVNNRDKVLHFVCSSSAPTTPSPMNDSLSNAIGTPCSTNALTTWLDLYLVIDVSEGMTQANLLQLSGQMATLFEGLTIGQTPKHSTRVGIITYASNATVRLTLSNCSDATTLLIAVYQLSNYRLPNDTGTNIRSGLETVLSLRAKEKSYRPTAVMVIAASYNSDAGDDPTQVAEIMKQDGITILTIAFESSGALNAGLKNLSSLGYSYENTDPDLFEKLLFAFTQINCFCPPKTYQLRIYNDTNENFTTYADCLYSSGGAAADAIYAEKVCEKAGDVLASVTSEQKLDFLIDIVIANTMPDKREFTVGAHLDTNHWQWYGYNNAAYPIGDFPGIPSSSSGNYGYFYKAGGFNWNFSTQTKGKAKPYICQQRACDTTFFCNLTEHSSKIF